MRLSKWEFILPFLAVTLIGGYVWFFSVKTVEAQCGSQASSCKNCHEVQAQMPVNADGTGWHQSHAFGDFCANCHAGNVQATEKDAAHEGMIPPLSDIKANCAACHPNDLNDRAQVYATLLGVEVGAASSAPASGGDSDAAPASTDMVPSVAPNLGCNEIVVDDPTTVNYAQNYDEIVLGKRPTNWGNAILMAMIGLLMVGGGGYVITREKLINVSFGDTRRAEGEYPVDVVEMLPKIAELKTGARRSLKNILDNKKADKVLDLIDAVVRKDEE